MPPPPGQPPADPPPQYAAYPRGAGAGQYGTADKLQALSDGYFGLNIIFLINIVLSLGSRFSGVTAKTPSEALGILAGYALVVGLVVGFGSYHNNKKIAFGADWKPGMAVLASVLMALNSVFCCGIIGYVIVQNLAFQEMKKYGLKGGFFGVKKSEIAAKVAEMRATPQPPPNFQP